MIPTAQATPTFYGEFSPSAPTAPPTPPANSVMYSQNPLAWAMPHSSGMRYLPTQITQPTPYPSGIRYFPTQITQTTPYSSGIRYSPTQITQTTPYPLTAGVHVSTNQTAHPPAPSGAMQCFPKPTVQITPSFSGAHNSMPRHPAPQIAHQQSPSAQRQRHDIYPMEPHHQWPVLFSPRSVNPPYHPPPGLILPESSNQTTVFVQNPAGQHRTNNHLPDRPYGAELSQGSAPAACQPVYLLCIPGGFGASGFVRNCCFQPWGGQLNRPAHHDLQRMLVQWLLYHQGRHVLGEILYISADGDNCLGFFSLPDCPQVQIKFRFRLNSSHRPVLARSSVSKFHIHGQLQLNTNRLHQYVYNLSPNDFLNLRDQTGEPCRIPISLQCAAIKHKKTNIVILTRELREIVDYLNNLGSTPVKGKVLRWNKRTSCRAMHKIENKNRYIKFLFEIPEPHRNLGFDELKRLFSAVHCKLSFDKEGLTGYVIEIGLEGFRADDSPDDIIAIRGKDVQLIPAGGDTVS